MCALGALRRIMFVSYPAPLYLNLRSTILGSLSNKDNVDDKNVPNLHFQR